MIYHYRETRKLDAMMHVYHQGGDILVGVGHARLVWDDIYGSVNEYQAGVLIARHYPEVDYSSWNGRHFGVTSWNTRTYPAN